MSGYGSGNDQRRSLAVGYDHHLVKPFTPDALLALLREACETEETGSRDNAPRGVLHPVAGDRLTRRPSQSTEARK